MGTGGLDHHCPTCRGVGVTCPGCGNAGWVVDVRLPITTQTADIMVRCPVCEGDEDRQAAAIRAVLGQIGET